MLSAVLVAFLAVEDSPAACDGELFNYITADQSPDGIAKVTYQSKDGRTSKTFGALDWLAQLTTHIPGKNEQMVRYYGYYSNKSRGLRRKADKEDDVPALIDSDLSAKEFRRNGAHEASSIIIQMLPFGYIEKLNNNYPMFESSQV